MPRSKALVLSLFGLIGFLMNLTIMQPTLSQAIIPRPEYPRPDFERSAWLNLNGEWDFRIDPQNIGEASAWYTPDSSDITGHIIVPFPWQSQLSGVANLLHRGVAWYRRQFTVPPDWEGEQVILRFGAVDYFTRVWVNGTLMGDHEGGYTPFEFDITSALHEGANTVVVRVDDPADLREIPHGKQRSLPPNPWEDVSFTTTSGIWQTVWLEARPQNYIVSARITPNVAHSQAIFDLQLRSSLDSVFRIEVTSPDGEALMTETAVTAHDDIQTVRIEFAIPNPILWDIRQPNLYYVTLRLESGGKTDTVRTYFGMRSIERSGRNVLLNGRPIYLMSALDQGYWHDGLYTAPSDEALRADIQYALDLGLNGLRKHIKIEDPRFYYWADQLGILIWCDAPSPVIFSELARRRLIDDLRRMIERDYNHPSIVIWSPYNESWGLEFRSNRDVQEYLAALYHQIKAWDPTRLVVDNSGWRHVVTDIADSHKYTSDPVEWRGFMTLLANDPMSIQVLGHPFYALGRYRYNGEPIMISEYGAGWQNDRSWDFHWQTNEIRRHAGVVGYTYTELYDIEHEYAGFALYDRTPKDFGYDPAMINSPDFVVLDFRGSPQLQPGSPLRVAASISAYGLPALTTGRMQWSLRTVAPEPTILATGEQPFHISPYTVTEIGAIELAVPEYAGPAQLWAEVFDDTGTSRAANYLNFEVMGAQPPRTEHIQTERASLYVARLSLDEHEGAFSPLGPLQVARIQPTGERPILIGRDTGYVEMCVPPPEGETAWSWLRVEAEVASNPSLNYTTQALEGYGYPSDVIVTMNGIELGTWHLPDRPVNALGALTRLNGLGSGEHGYWMSAETSDPVFLNAIQSAARASGCLAVRFRVAEDAAHPGGITLFGARGGRYGRDPIVTIGLP